jgi:hypothetical protein
MAAHWIVFFFMLVSTLLAGSFVFYWRQNRISALENKESTLKSALVVLENEQFSKTAQTNKLSELQRAMEAKILRLENDNRLLTVEYQNLESVISVLRDLQSNSI